MKNLQNGDRVIRRKRWCTPTRNHSSADPTLNTYQTPSQNTRWVFVSSLSTTICMYISVVFEVHSCAWLCLLRLVRNWKSQTTKRKHWTLRGFHLAPIATDTKAPPLSVWIQHSYAIKSTLKLQLHRQGHQGQLPVNDQNTHHQHQTQLVPNAKGWMFDKNNCHN